VNRRAFIATLAGILGAPLVAEAQEAAKSGRVGYLAALVPLAVDETFGQAMRELDYTEGRNITIETRFARGDACAASVCSRPPSARA